jgi:pyruvate,water dikinase
VDLVVALRDAEQPGTGGKAAGLARLIRAGLPVPDGFVVTHAAFVAVAGELPRIADDDVAHRLAAVASRVETTAVPTDVEAAVAAALARLGATADTALAVRSSVSIEDGAAGAAAGVMSSRTRVPARDVWAAIRVVWASACTPLVARYARARGREVDRLEVGVVIQRHVPGERLTVYTRPPGRPGADEAWIERGGDAATEQLARAAADPRVALARAAEAAIDAAATGADVELVAGAGDAGLVVVQARPIVHPPPRAPRLPPPPTLLAPLVEDRARGRIWTWDVEHNPEPLSASQAGLVAAVEAAGVAPYRMCTVAGYLYTAEDRTAPIGVTLPGGVVALRDKWSAYEARMAAALAAAGSAPTVEAAVAAYVAFYAVWAGDVAPLLAAGRANIKRAPGSPIARAIARAARGELTRDAVMEKIGDMALAWDVVAPTLREQPWIVDAAIEAARRSPPPAPPAPAASRPSFAEVVMELSEEDDVWFAKAQALVRHALVRAGRELGLLPGDEFWLPLDELARAAVDPIAGAARAAAARAAAARAAAWQMPLVAGRADPARGWTGSGAGGRAVGRVRRIDTGVVAPGTIVVARTMTPALALLVPGAAALVSEEGGALSHGAAIARELGIPFVVGCKAAAQLADGERIEVDGDAGTVRRVDG